MGVPKRHQRREVKVTVVYVCLLSLLLWITDLEVFQGGRFGRLRARLHPYGRLPSARKSGTGERNIEFREQKMQLTTLVLQTRGGGNNVAEYNDYKNWTGSEAV